MTRGHGEGMGSGGGDIAQHGAALATLQRRGSLLGNHGNG